MTEEIPKVERFHNDCVCPRCLKRLYFEDAELPWYDDELKEVVCDCGQKIEIYARLRHEYRIILSSYWYDLQFESDIKEAHEILMEQEGQR